MEDEKMQELEAQEEGEGPGHIPHLKMVFNQGVLSNAIIKHAYPGAGTEDDPYVVNWIDNDPRNPMLFPMWKKWSLTILVAWATLCVSFDSSAYSGGIQQIIGAFKISDEVATLGISLFVLGFAIGPLLWAPLSELYGRQFLFFGTYAMLVLFTGASIASKNSQTLIILRFFAGAFGSSPLTNAGGVIADMFPARQRGIAMSVFAVAPFLGPVLGPIIGNFVGETVGWQWVLGVMTIFTGLMWLSASLLVPETYPPVLLRRRAQALSKLTGKVYLSQGDADQGQVSIAHVFKTSLSRPWILLFREPIVLLLSIYMAIIYGTLYMCFGAFPIIFEQTRHWSQGIGGLSFLGVGIGMLAAVVYSLWDNQRYLRVCDKDPNGFAPPEARLPPCMIGGAALPISLFWFAWTSAPSIHWIVPIIGTVPFGFGLVLVFLSIMNYLIDAYVIFAASVLAANSVLRSLFGAIFPLFTTYMYDGLGIHWATSVPAFLALVCVPMPFLFYKYGPAIRARCKYAAEADRFLKRMRGELSDDEGDDDDERAGHISGTATPTARPDGDVKVDNEASSSEDDFEKPAGATHTKESHRLALEREEEAEQEAFDYSYDDPVEREAIAARRRAARNHAATRESAAFEEIRGPSSNATPDGSTSQMNLQKMRTGASMSAASLRSARSGRSLPGEYDHSPFDLDRVNTRDSFRRRERTVERKELGKSRSRERKT